MAKVELKVFCKIEVRHNSEEKGIGGCSMNQRGHISRRGFLKKAAGVTGYVASFPYIVPA